MIARDEGWEDAYEELAYTAFALATQADDAAIAPLHAKVTGVLADWERIEADRMRLRGAALAARASVHVADAALDLALGKLGEAALAASERDRAREPYAGLFPEAHEQVIELGLDGELPAAMLALARLEESGDERLRPHLATLRACVAVGSSALVARADAYAELGRLDARIEAWLDGADAVLRVVGRELERLADERGLGKRWIASFFEPG